MNRPKSSALTRYITAGFLSLALTPVCALADVFSSVWENRAVSQKALRFEPSVSYFNSNLNFDSDGRTALPQNLSGYNRLHANARLAYGLSEDFTFFTDLSWARVEVLHTTVGGVTYGLTDQTLGLNWRLYRSQATDASLHLQASADVPLYSSTSTATTNAPALGDQALGFTVGALADYPISRNEQNQLLLTGGAGYQWRAKDFSAGIPWSAALRMRQRTEGVEFLAQLQGLQSLNTDPSSPLLATSARSLTQSGGSYYLNAINPSFLHLRGRLGYRFSPKSSVFVGLTQGISGTQAPKYFSAEAGFEFTWTTAHEPPLKRHTQTGFVSYSGEARVTRVNDRFNLFKINRGSDAAIKVGDILDVFAVNTSGDVTEVIARARVMDVKDGEAALKVIEFYKEVWIEEGFVVKSQIR
jgi:hypothetical protein